MSAARNGVLIEEKCPWCIVTTPHVHEVDVTPTGLRPGTWVVSPIEAIKSQWRVLRFKGEPE